MLEMPKAYNPREVEDKIYKKWEESGFFNPDNLDLPNKAGKFSIAMPPPNATGVLHLGHASMLAYEDLMIRYNRMKGKKTMWLPGTDHAAIATQTKVEKIIAKEGKTKYDLGREKFLERVNEYIENSRSAIKNQTKKMGSSCDWSRERYTLDEGLSRAVREVFVKMYNDGLIYRGDRIVNWCPRCESTLADDEVEYKEEKIPFYYFKYGPIIIGTARPETKFADKIIVVHPDDSRYKHLIGKSFIVPWIEGDVEARVIADKTVDKDFGTGAMTITPAHSFEDFQLAQKHKIEIVKIIDEKGNLTKVAGSFAGMNANKARKAIVEKMKRKGLVDHIDENYIHNLSVCYRCDTPIEPLLSLQWFISVSSKFKVQSSKFKGIKKGQKVSLKELALAVVKNGQIEIIPDRFKKIYYHWMENLHDWCISRQIWFGHRIPVYYKFKVQSSKFKVAVQNSKIEEEIYVGLPESQEVLLVRHGETDRNAKGFYGHPKDKLNKNGRKQAFELLEKIKSRKISRIISSPFPRAMETAEIISAKIEAKVEVWEELKEVDEGILVGKKRGENKLNFEEMLENKTGETFEEMFFRASKVWEKIKNLGKQNGDIIMVGHRGFNCVLYASAKGISAQDLIKYRRIWNLNNSEWEQIKLIIAPNGNKNKNWTQDPDTLDTWFSSGLWTFSTLLDQDHKKYKTFEDWVAGSPDLKNFHPTSMIETGYDILFFWVARMVLMTTYAIGEIPFENVYLHGMVRDKQGRKMSKSLGNGIDPIKMIEKYGADALRLSMIIGASPGNDIKLYEQKIEGYRNFVNKLWNVSRYILMNVDSTKVSKSLYRLLETENDLTLADKWILEHLENLKYVVNNAIENYQFSFAFDSDEGIRSFMWDKFADWYLEVSKVQGKNDAILIYVLETLLKLCHPFIPFVTEQIWQEMGKEKLLMVEKWPESKGYMNLTKVNLDFLTLQGIIMEIRKIKNDYGIALKEKVKAIVNADVLINIDGMNDENKDENVKIIKDLNKETVEVIKENIGVIEKLAGLKSLKIASDIEKPKGWIQFFQTVSVYVNVGDSIDIKKEIEKTKDETEKVKKYVNQIKSKLSNDNFIANAPTPVVEKEEEKLKESEEKLERLEEKLKSLL